MSEVCFKPVDKTPAISDIARFDSPFQPLGIGESADGQGGARKMEKADQ